jgi:hypothetical protein
MAVLSISSIQHEIETCWGIERDVMAYKLKTGLLVACAWRSRPWNQRMVLITICANERGDIQVVNLLQCYKSEIIVPLQLPDGFDCCAKRDYKCQLVKSKWNNIFTKIMYSSRRPESKAEMSIPVKWSLASLRVKWRQTRHICRSGNNFGEAVFASIANSDDAVSWGNI